ncbi:SAM-dependent methyltransferase [Elysia marginata]|uniref:SAM-dependent methyltransferase n=1 Tax=Elysia marginata TaxID=1093978 RepID=A0AAV4JYL2_9GAST|nr:SAM-dependent methyltransferase [Elysia marginata]
MLSDNLNLIRSDRQSRRRRASTITVNAMRPRWHAHQVPNCEFKVGYSDKLPFLKSGTVDLFCSGESFNLMPQKETFAEADRVLKPGGSIAIFGYDIPSTDIPELQESIQKYGMKIFPFYPKETAQLLDRFHNLEMPYPGWIR